MSESDPLLVVGRIVRAHALKGEVIVQPASAGSDVLLDVKSVWVGSETSSVARRVRKAQPQGKGVLLGLEGISDRNAAEALIGASVLLRESELPEAGEDEFYVQDLIGLRVESPAGDLLGSVVDIESSENMDWLVVEAGGKRSLVPLTEPLVKVDLDAEKIVLDAPEGLLDGSEA